MNLFELGFVSSRVLSSISSSSIGQKRLRIEVEDLNEPRKRWRREGGAEVVPTNPSLRRETKTSFVRKFVCGQLVRTTSPNTSSRRVTNAIFALLFECSAEFE